MKTKVTIIGAGNIGGATAIGLCNFAETTVTARTQRTLDKFKDLPIKTSLDNNEAVRGADVVIFSVKPWLMEEVVRSVLPSLDLDTQIMVSMAPGVKSADFLSWLGDGAKFAYVIPNTAIEVGESMTFVLPVSVSEEQTSLLCSLFPDFINASPILG